MITCREFVEFLMEYLEQDLGAPQRETFEEHMRGCPPCETYLDTYRETIRLGKLCRDPEGPVPADTPEELVRAVLAARKAGSG